MIINILQNHYNLADLCSLNFGNKQNKGIAFSSHINYIRHGACPPTGHTRRDLQRGSAILALRRAVLLETSENINPFPA